MFAHYKGILVENARKTYAKLGIQKPPAAPAAAQVTDAPKQPAQEKVQRPLAAHPMPAQPPHNMSEADAREKIKKIKQLVATYEEKSFFYPTINDETIDAFNAFIEEYEDHRDSAIGILNHMKKYIASENECAIGFFSIAFQLTSKNLVNFHQKVLNIIYNPLPIVNAQPQREMKKSR